MTIRDEKHLAFIRRLPCVKCSATPCEAAHIRSGTGGGTGLKPSDEWTVPLCHEHHAEQHRIGEASFWRNLDAARQLARNLWLLSGHDGQHDFYAAITTICNARAKCFLS